MKGAESRQEWACSSERSKVADVRFLPLDFLVNKAEKQGYWVIYFLLLR